MRTIGVKYCGGCRSGYHRVAAAKEIEQAFCTEAVRFEGAAEGVPYDLLLVICGCGTKCAAVDGLLAENGLVYVCCPADVPGAVEKIRALQK